MKVLHVIGGIRRQGGGPSRSSQGLVAGLRALGVDAWLLTLNKREEPWVKGVDKFINGGDFANTLQNVKPDLVHIHGIWDPALHRCAKTCRKLGIRYIIAPRGMLEPWSLKTKWLKKKIARFLYQDCDLKYAAALHATAACEAEQFKRLGFKNYCVISPNGVNLPSYQNEMGVRTKEGTRRALYVSRMHAKKGVLELIESWNRVSPKGWICELVYTLNGDAEMQYEAQVKARVKELGLEDSFVFAGPFDDDKKWKAYARANLFILPTYSENFGIVVAEALWAGVPVITTKGTPWEELESHQCGWWIELPSEEVKEKGEQWRALDSALREAISTADLKQLGQNGRALVEAKYTWREACKAMVRGYEQILNPCESVPCDTYRNFGNR